MLKLYFQPPYRNKLKSKCISILNIGLYPPGNMKRMAGLKKITV